MYKYSTGASNALLMAKRIQKSANCSYIGTEHILAGVMSTDCTARKVLLASGLDNDEFFKAFQEAIDPKYTLNDYTPRAKNLLQVSNDFANMTNGGYIATEHFLIAILLDSECMANKILKKLGIDLYSIKKGLEKELGIRIELGNFGNFGNMGNINPASLIQEMTKTLFGSNADINMTFNTNGNSGAFNFNGMNEGISNEERGRSKGTEKLKFGTDLTALAKEGKLDPVVGRKKEIERIIQILSRRTKNNPVLVGEPGVGKSAVVEGLAQMIVKGQVPELLRGKSIFSLDIGGMLAGSKYRGDFEERLKDFLDQVKKRGDIIIFIDEIHNIVGAGATQDGSLDAAELLKPMLARGEMQTIGATTIDEYRKYIEKDAALERRFQPVNVDQPSVSETIEILKGLRDKYEAHHKVRITDEAIKAAAELSDRYISDRFLPDKAIDLIDEAASRARLDNYTAPPNFHELEEKLAALENERSGYVRRDDYDAAARVQTEIVRIKEEIAQKNTAWEEARTKTSAFIGYEEVANIVGQWTGIPVVKLTQSESEKLINLEKVLHERVIGQNEAVDAVSRAIRRARAGLKDPKRPIGSFIFVGPTGVGKTELAKAIASAVFGDENQLIRVDMSEYMEKHSVSKLVGAPPGYVGFDENGQLTEKVRRKPYSVILFDEVEKAHPDVFNLLLQILDDGRLTDSKGRVVDFKNTIIIMTSNVGASRIAKITTMGFGESQRAQVSRDYDVMKDRIMNELRENFKPEFLNRVDDIIVFHRLSEEETATILTLMINSLSKRLREKNISIALSPEAKKVILKQGYNPEYGARPLRRVIEHLIEDKLSEELLRGNISFGDDVLIDHNGEQFLFEKR
ncbi:MAG: ATP-dependent Clp protease ATP-binding subunit [Clostridia bacterium]|nr:ATP-dependent Clp protease ATP-binding subunit [Clostridia bacterium]